MWCVYGVMYGVWCVDVAVCGVWMCILGLKGCNAG